MKWENKTDYNKKQTNIEKHKNHSLHASTVESLSNNALKMLRHVIDVSRMLFLHGKLVAVFSCPLPMFTFPNALKCPLNPRLLLPQLLLWLLLACMLIDEPPRLTPLTLLYPKEDEDELFPPNPPASPFMLTSV